MKLEKAINLLTAIGSILAGIGEMLKQFNTYQQKELPTRDDDVKRKN